MNRRKHNILAVITARGGSKGIPGKNIKEFGGKPLISYSIEAARNSDMITHTVVSTEDEHIARVARDWGGQVPFMRPAELSGDETTHLPVIQHAIEHQEDALGVRFDYVVILQPTSPFRLKADIDEPLRKLIDTGADSVVTLVETSNADHPVKAKKLEGDRVLAYVMDEPEGIRRQELPTAYRRSGAIYAMRRDLIMSGRLYGEHVVGHVVPRERSVDIDEPIDWLKAEWMLKQLQEAGYDF